MDASVWELLGMDEEIDNLCGFVSAVCALTTTSLVAYRGEHGLVLLQAKDQFGLSLHQLPQYHHFPRRCGRL